MAKVIKVLSIDGGGIRGIIPALILSRIEQKTGKPISKLFDLIAGTSSGGILALGLTKPSNSSQSSPHYSAKDLVSFYENDGKEIFTTSFFRRVYTVENLLEERYTSYGVEKVLDKYFGESRLKDALTEVIVPSYEIERRTTFFFKSLNAKEREGHDFLMSEVARSTSAAPTYFEPKKISFKNSSDYFALIDGGVFANNPAMCAYVEAKTMYPDADEIVLVSIGTGEQIEPLLYNNAKGWGLAQWARPLLEVMFDGVSDTVDYQLSKLLPPSKSGMRMYYRFQANLEHGTGDLDNSSPENIRMLRFTAEDLIRTNQFSFDSLCRQLTEIS